MALDFLLRVFSSHLDQEAIVWRDQAYSYGWLLERVEHWRRMVQDDGVRAGTVVILEADFAPNSVALLLALIETACIVVPLTSTLEGKRDEFVAIAQGELVYRLNERDAVSARPLDRTATHELYSRLRSRGHPGLVLFSSGSTGQSKAAVHDLVPLLEKFKVRRQRLRTMSFLLYDHIGGLNTMLYTLSNGGCLVIPPDRTPDGVLHTVEAHRVQLLPTSPTFLNLVLISQAHTRHRIDSLETVTYGTEPMPESTLRRLHGILPHVRLQQTYGLSEVGILRSKSKDSGSVWVKVGGEGFETRVVDGVLHVRAQSAMLGYLNAPSPFAAEGWMNTGDRVEVDGEYVRFLGRQSEIINVGGEKVYPAEVESVLQELPNVAEVTVFGEAHPITGSIVCARVTLLEEEEPRAVRERLRRFCRERLEGYKVPAKIVVSDQPQHSPRFKKIRSTHV